MCSCQSTMTDSDTTPTMSYSDGRSSSMGPYNLGIVIGAPVGAVVVCILLVTLLVVIIILCLLMRKSKKEIMNCGSHSATLESRE